jgi:hypothetical protein
MDDAKSEAAVSDRFSVRMKRAPRADSAHALAMLPERRAERQVERRRTARKDLIRRSRQGDAPSCELGAAERSRAISTACAAFSAASASSTSEMLASSDFWRMVRAAEAACVVELGAGRAGAREFQCAATIMYVVRDAGREQDGDLCCRAARNALRALCVRTLDADLRNAAISCMKNALICSDAARVETCAVLGRMDLDIDVVLIIVSIAGAKTLPPPQIATLRNRCAAMLSGGGASQQTAAMALVRLFEANPEVDATMSSAMTMMMGRAELAQYAARAIGIVCAIESVGGRAGKALIDCTRAHLFLLHMIDPMSESPHREIALWALANMLSWAECAAAFPADVCELISMSLRSVHFDVRIEALWAFRSLVRNCAVSLFPLMDRLNVFDTVASFINVNQNRSSDLALDSIESALRRSSDLSGGCPLSERMTAGGVVEMLCVGAAFHPIDAAQRKCESILNTYFHDAFCDGAPDDRHRPADEGSRELT